jgi:cysteine desulfurase
MREAWANPSSIHAEGRRSGAVMEVAREDVANFASVSARDVVFTAGATEANNLALAHAPALVTSRIEHPSVVRLAEVLENRGKRVVWLPVPPTGRIDPADVERALRDLPEGVAVALMAVNHETGVLQPVGDVLDIVRRRGGRLHVDAAQAAGKVPAGEWSAFDSASLGAHKFRGPKGIGALVLRSKAGVEPVLVGGAQERGLRPGTGDAALAAGFGAAVRRAAGGIERYAALAVLRDKLESVARDFGKVNGEGSPRAPHVSNVSFDGWRGDELAAALDLLGLSVSSGSACSAGTPEPSAVVSAMHGTARAAAAVRFSLGDETTESDIDEAIDLLIRALRRQSSRG